MNWCCSVIDPSGASSLTRKVNITVRDSPGGTSPTPPRTSEVQPAEQVLDAFGTALPAVPFPLVARQCVPDELERFRQLLFQVRVGHVDALTHGFLGTEQL